MRIQNLQKKILAGIDQYSVILSRSKTEAFCYFLTHKYTYRFNGHFFRLSRLPLLAPSVQGWKITL